METVHSVDEQEEEEENDDSEHGTRPVQSSRKPNPQCNQMHLDETIMTEEDVEAKHNLMSTEETGVEWDGAEAQPMVGAFQNAKQTNSL